MEITFMPKTKLGIYSLGLGIFFLVVSAFFWVFAEVYDIITSDIWISIFAGAAVLAELVALVLGIMAVAKEEEGSILVFANILLGILVLAWVVFA